ncbi:hypothetical protein [Myxosarcina sp. GI1]|uniref:hypothetical protein n=1 Tax=Myxosarcina sp. GI1 TaxID=1541065 RepID=UPI00068F630E|nr:hypothetical protein [Myxosarcina sp. GI1]
MALKKLIINTLVGVSLLAIPIKANSKDLICSANSDKTYFFNEKPLKFSTVKSIITAKFAPKDDLGQPIELSKLATKLGYDHFNWVSYVERDPYGIANNAGSLMVTPYNDPPIGGYQYETADNLPFYWDMSKCEGCQEYHHYQHPRITRRFELVFEDFPSDYRLKPGEAIEFVTHLVGVKNYDLDSNEAQWKAINTFKWQLTNSPQGRGRVAIVQQNVDLTELSPTLLAVMQADGGILPERVYELVPQLKLPETVAIAGKIDISTQASCNI